MEQDATPSVVPTDEVPARFHRRFLHDEAFAVAVRDGHAFADEPTPDRYCRLKHLVVSLTRDDRSFADDALAASGHFRRVALAVPNFMIALALVAQTGLRQVEVPLPLRNFRISALTPGAAMRDAGLTWFFGLLSDPCIAGDRDRNG